MVIKFIVYSDNNEEALDQAKDICEGMTGDGNDFDYGTFFDEDSTMSGKGRWGKLPIVVLYDSKKGKKLVDDGWKEAEEGYKEALLKIREALKFHTDEEIIEQKIIGTKNKILDSLGEKKDNTLPHIRHYFGVVGSYSGSDSYLYHEGGAIRSKEELKRVLDKYGIKDSRKVYVVPCDVHY